PTWTKGVCSQLWPDIDMPFLSYGNASRSYHQSTCISFKDGSRNALGIDCCKVY
ncbi:hypothetical protein GBA52_028847, partial [Prunus armeniaca]